ncbi:MAG: DEAD/DEAH box helicase [Myxococcales bacterium]|nr:DEAD/DEAH box helicase [Myxococcales bacterium]
MTFDELRLIEPLLRAVRSEGYDQPTPIQEQAIPHLLDGRDLMGCAQTGTGKTAAFALPILQHLVITPRGPNPVGSGRRPIRVLVLTPTRELATQIGDSFATYGKLIPEHKVQGVPLRAIRHTVIFGGVGQSPQAQALKTGVDVVVATPGRLLDLAGQKLLDFSRLEVFVLDEADRMLDMGFLHDVRRVIALLPSKRQTLMFSATMPKDIADLAGAILRDPVRVAVAPPAATVDAVDQSVYHVAHGDKRALLHHLLGDPSITRALIFTRTKHGANKMVESLGKAHIGAQAIHGNKSQSARERALADFKRGATRILVATDIAARGIDIDGITHVINFELPNIPETYVHRIGRTARAGASGHAMSLCEPEEREFLSDIERLIRREIPVVPDHPFRSTAPAAAPRPAPQQQQRNNRGGGERRATTPQARRRRYGRNGAR